MIAPNASGLSLAAGQRGDCPAYWDLSTKGLWAVTYLETNGSQYMNEEIPAQEVAVNALAL